jgi:hypothetical protein
MLAACSLSKIFSCPASRAPDPQLLSAVDAYLKLNARFRTYLEAKDDREGGNPRNLRSARALNFLEAPPQTEKGHRLRPQ